ncbi:CAP domain-containing protein [Sinorhizobium sp. BG8]|uniref:M10 family metallopeptidase C-terminal domain-containing protein n=1 Tax=Sinorhizobium sp. BG8 TaxID=2613773 RepID=UPI00193D5836|nr:CAP domain-containing protein [Sinorhizobium sp. BG8]QRM54903.1 calcium-binding protein [Sinorhizobium sp. BG8]
MAQPTAREQLMLELVNRARLDPITEAKRYGISLNDNLPSGTISGSTKAPLAMNYLLINSARGHSQWMIDTDTFSHTGKGGSTPTQRMQAANYSLTGSWATGENIAWTGTTGSLDLTSAIISQHKNLFLSAGHRENILEESFREIGIGQIAGKFTSGGTTYNASMVTQNFAKSGSSIFLTGVIYNDTSGDDFYSVGEGRNDVRISSEGKTTDSIASGGYQMKVSAGTNSVAFGTGSSAVKLEAKVLSENAKIDLVDGKFIESSVSLTLTSGASGAKLLGRDALALTGSSASERLVGNVGSNRIDGKNGNDSISGGAGNDKITGGGGADKLSGGSGADTFVFNLKSDSTAASSGRDTIIDFSHSQGDRIDLRSLDADTTRSGTQDFSFIGTKSYSGDAGELRYSKKASDTYIYADLNGDKKSDFVIHLDDAMTLYKSDFLL